MWYLRSLQWPLSTQAALLSPCQPRSLNNQAGGKLQTDGVAKCSEMVGPPVLCMGEARAFS